MNALWHDAAAAWAAWTAPLTWHLAFWVAVALAVDLVGGRRLWPQLRLGLWLLVGLRLVTPVSIASPVGLVSAEAPVPAVAVFETSWIPIAFAVWLAGVLLLAAVFAVRRRRAWSTVLLVAAPSDARLRRLARRAAARIGLTRMPRLAWVPASMGASVIGTAHPLVLIPRGRDDEEIEHALLHELGHVRRGDLWMQAAFHVLCVAYWFHPLVWVAGRRAHRARELACDQTVAASLGEADAYRRTLLAAAHRRISRPLFGATPFAWKRAAILSRIDALESAGWRHRLRQRTGATAGLLLAAALLLPAAAHWVPPDPLRIELEIARGHLEAAKRKDPGYGSMHARYAAMRVAALEKEIAARRSGAR